MTVTLEEATIADTEALIAFMRELWQTDTVSFNEQRSRTGLSALLADRNLGRVWLIRVNQVVAGYLVLTFGFSLEFAGRDAFIDEFFISRDFRGQGRGAEVLDAVAVEAAALGVHALHLEVADKNERAEALYLRKDFQRHNRRLMTRWLIQ